ncbi:hypothetical protein NH286_03410 [Anaerococcus sp. NML200574]|uniref:hypothetical protein n=1 Tax=Anaerococcus sp. NML200574 TaxID=2954486 RepID=UPI0022371956|nr:hypothetical protein [Anaerococcus sp. NML200574]MCW6678201.1 hypothetical protein [Anaerococcus sp. NML200574]
MRIFKKIFKIAQKTPIDKETKYQEYLKRIKSGERLEGSDREDFCEISADKAIDERKNSDNPKFHKTDNEKKLESEFHKKNHSIIEDYENRIYISDKTDYNKLKSNLVAYDEFKEFCYSNGDGGKIYFQDMWEFCYNSKIECFSYKETILENMQNYLDANRAVVDIIEILKINETYLQKDLKEKINYCTPQEIGAIIKEMVSKNIITREKYKNTYLLKLNVDI